MEHPGVDGLHHDVAKHIVNDPKVRELMARIPDGGKVTIVIEKGGNVDVTLPVLLPTPKGHVQI